MFIETLEFTIPVDLCEIFSTMKRGPQANLEFPASVNSYGTTQDANVQVVLRANKLTFKVDGVSSDASMISKSECRTLKLSVFDVDRSLMPLDENDDYQSNDISTIPQPTSTSAPLKRAHEQSISIPSAKSSRSSYSDSPRPRSPPHRRSQPRASPRPTENSQQSKPRNHNSVNVKQEPEDPDLIEIEPDPEDVVPKTETPYMQIDYSSTGPCTQTSQAALDRLSFPQTSQSQSSSSSSFQQNVPHVPDYAEPGPSQQQRHRGDQSADDYLVFQGDEEGDDNEADYSNDEKDLKTTNDEDEDFVIEMNIATDQMDEAEYPCDFCEKTYATKLGLKYHSRTHSGAFPYQCPVCSRGFHTNLKLKEHQVRHSKKPFATCKICGKGVSTKATLINHLALHSSAKLPCSKCSKLFHTKTAVKQHMLFHSERTSFCKQCNKYYHERLFKKHVNETHGDMKFKCDTCNFESRTRRLLNRHLTKHSCNKKDEGV